MCSSSPQIQTGLEIGRQAELYQREHNIEATIDTFRSSLSLLVPLLGNEPKGVRKDLLHQQVGSLDLFLFLFSAIQYSIA